MACFLESSSCSEAKYWCSVTYHELDNQVGEVFNASHSDVVIDGFTDPSVSGVRFSVGLLSNNHRTSDIELARGRIGKGIHLYYASGEVCIECLSDYSVFVQSHCENVRNDIHVEAICKILANCSLTVYNNQMS